MARALASPRAKKQQQQQERLVGYGLLALVVIWILGFILLIGVWKPTNENHEEHVAPGHLMYNHNNNNLYRPSKDMKQSLHLGQAKAHDYLNLYESPLLIFTCSRAEYLKKTLEEIFKHLPKQCHIGCPIIVSQDGTDAKVQSAIQKLQAKFATTNIPLIHLQHKPDGTTMRLRGNAQQLAYQKLAIHYGWALKQVFSGQVYEQKNSYFDDEWPLPQRVVILEEDILIAPDFFEYFAKTAEVLDTDYSLLAVSAFNDNGYKSNVANETRVLRSDFFPGLGWLMTRRLWMDELEAKWPKAYWDDWLREPDQRQGRQVLRPEISRTFHFGTKGGASLNQYGDRLTDVQLNSKHVDWKTLDLGYLEPSTYQQDYYQMVTSATIASNLKDATEKVKEQNTRLEYKNIKQFQQFAKSLSLMADEKAGVPRTAYKGIVETRYFGEHFLFLTPPDMEDQFFNDDKMYQ